VQRQRAVDEVEAAFVELESVQIAALIVNLWVRRKLRCAGEHLFGDINARDLRGAQLRAARQNQP
jgi:hypothetical protein